MNPNPTLPAADKRVLRELVRTYAEIANLPVQAEKAELWRRLNRLEPVRPLVWINEIPWHELAVDDELALRCEDPWCRGLESGLRQTLYQWRHFPGDMVVEPILHTTYVCGPTSTYADYGIEERVERPGGDVGSVHWRTVISSEADVDRLRTPDVWVDWAATEGNHERLAEVCDGLLSCAKRGIVHQWCSPWDQMIHWYDIQQLFTDMIDRPALVHRLLARFMEAVHAVLDRQTELGLLATSNGNHRVGSGGLGITDELPQPDCDPARVRPCDQWGTSTGQIFSEVSPAMHEEFCLQYERPYLERFGLSCYGCCEPLHNKLGILRSVRNLRRVSMSPWIDVSKAAAEVGGDYVFSSKPNPALLAFDTWQPELVRQSLAAVLEQARGCRVELILKDISTLRGEPRRLWEWESVAMAVAEDEAARVGAC